MPPDATATEPEARFWPLEDLPGLEFDPVLAEMLHEDPVCRVRMPNGEGYAWVVTRYEDVKMVSLDSRFSREALAGRSVTRFAPHFIPLDSSVNFTDPPEHTRLRRVVSKAFSYRSIERLRGRAQEIMDGLVAGMLRHGPPADLVEHIHGPFPMAVLSEVMGVPAEDWPRMHHWTGRIISATHGREASERAKEEMGAYIAELLRRRQSAAGEDVPGEDLPGEDVLSVFAAAVQRGELSEAEAVAFAVLIQASGVHAVTNNSGNMLYALLTHPDHVARLRDEPGLLPKAVEELLRFIPHRNGVGLSRIALEDVVVGDALIRAGEAIYVSYLSANRDPDVFADPDRIDFDRDPNPHVSFGHGPHYCVGPMLARLEAEIMISTLLDRFPGLRLAVPVEEVRWRRSALIRGPEALPVTW